MAAFKSYVCGGPTHIWRGDDNHAKQLFPNLRVDFLQLRGMGSRGKVGCNTLVLVIRPVLQRKDTLSEDGSLADGAGDSD